MSVVKNRTMKYLLATGIILVIVCSLFFAYFVVFGKIVHTTKDRTISKLSGISSVLEQYYLETGRYPVGDGDIAVLENLFPNSYYQNDSWINAIVYKTTSDDCYRLYSLGEDSVDNDGSGDDLLVTSPHCK